MKAKYILRGLGLGMIITAVVMGAYTRSAVADARVAVLKEYGIGEEATPAETLVDVGGSVESKEEMSAKTPQDAADAEPSTEKSAVPDNAPHSEAVQPEVQSVPDVAQAVEQSGEDAALGDDLEHQQEAAGAQNGTITIEISKGDDSGTIARKLYNAGLVESAAEYDAFLMQHGYDKRLSTGTKIIDASDSWLDIAEKLTNK